MKTILAILIATMLWQPATVVDVNNDVVAVEFADGNVYEFYGDNFKEGEDVEVFKVLDVIVDIR